MLPISHYSSFTSIKRWSCIDNKVRTFLCTGGVPICSRPGPCHQGKSRQDALEGIHALRCWLGDLPYDFAPGSVRTSPSSSAPPGRNERDEEDTGSKEGRARTKALTENLNPETPQLEEPAALRLGDQSPLFGVGCLPWRGGNSTGDGSFTKRRPKERT